MIERGGEVGLSSAVRTEGILADEAEVAFVLIPFFLEELVADGGRKLVEALQEI